VAEGKGYSHILKYTSLLGSVQGLIILVGLVRQKLVAIILGPDGVGLISIFNSTSKLLGDATNLGLPVSAVKKISEAYEQKNSTRMEFFVMLMRSWCLLTALFGMAVCVALAPLLDMLTFSWGSHTLHYVLLSPMIASMAITGGELAILKGVRQLGWLAKISVINVFVALLLSIPLLYIWGQAAIVPSLVITSFSQMVITIAYSYRLYKPRFSFSRRVLGKGFQMIRLGLILVVAAIVGSGVEFAIRSFLNREASLEVVGLYNVGYMIITTCAAICFSAMESDYFPRLSTENGYSFTMSQMANRQIEASLLMVLPMVIGIIIFVPLLLPLLFSSHFMAAAPMVQIASLSIAFRSMYLPLAYMPLARGDYKAFFGLELVSGVGLFCAMVLGFISNGLLGSGFAIAFCSLFDFLVSFAYSKIRYGYSLSGKVLKIICFHLPFVVAALIVAFALHGFLYWFLGSVSIIISALISYKFLK
jgi:O-antigen/teichoic acid export membrane protein